MVDIKERLKKANKVDEMKKKADKVRIAELEAENADLRTQLDEQAMALVELADIVVGVE